MQGCLSADGHICSLFPEMTCRVDDVMYQDGDVVSKSCSEVCTCVTGHVSCQSACAEEQVVMAPSSSCPRPLLVATEHACCRTWKCFPEGLLFFFFFFFLICEVILKCGESFTLDLGETFTTFQDYIFKFTDFRRFCVFFL